MQWIAELAVGLRVAVLQLVAGQEAGRPGELGATGAHFLATGIVLVASDVDDVAIVVAVLVGDAEAQGVGQRAATGHGVVMAAAADDAGASLCIPFRGRFGRAQHHRPGEAVAALVAGLRATQDLDLLQVPGGQRAGIARRAPGEGDAVQIDTDGVAFAADATLRHAADRQLAIAGSGDDIGELRGDILQRAVTGGFQFRARDDHHAAIGFRQRAAELFTADDHRIQQHRRGFLGQRGRRHQFGWRHRDHLRIGLRVLGGHRQRERDEDARGPAGPCRCGSGSIFLHGWTPRSGYWFFGCDSGPGHRHRRCPGCSGLPGMADSRSVLEHAGWRAHTGQCGGAQASPCSSAGSGAGVAVAACSSGDPSPRNSVIAT